MADERRSPFGEVDAESEARAFGGEADRPEFAETPLAQRALRPETYLIVGRRGSGKTALAQYLEREYRRNGAVVVRLEAAELESSALAYVFELATFGEVGFRNGLELALWRAVMQSLAGESSAIAEAVKPLLPPSFLAHMLRIRRSRRRQLGNSAALESGKAAVLDLAQRRRILVTIDSRERYDTTNAAARVATATLVAYAAEFHSRYGQRGIDLKLFVSEEAYPELLENLPNPAKAVREPLYLRWEPRDLVRLIGARLRRFAGASFRQFDANDPEDIFEHAWHPVFGRDITNAEGLQERTFSYVLRHTQLQPRQLILLCNLIVRARAKDDSSFPVSAEVIRAAVRRGTELLATEVFNAYRDMYRGALSSITSRFEGFPATFTGREFSRRLDDVPLSDKPRQSLINMGLIGVIRDRRESDHTIRAEFAYSRETRLTVLFDDECVIHPMFHSRLNIRPTTGEIILPFATDVENPGEGAARPYYRQVRAFLGLPRRAESGDPATLVQTFVNVGTLMTLLSSRDHQIVYGRRGTGKTHALRYLAESRSRKDDVAVYIDLREIGSTGGIYPDSDIPITERATRLLKDVLGAVHDVLRAQIVKRTGLDLQQLGPALDELADAITEVVVTGTVQTDHAVSASDTSTAREAAKVAIAATPSAGLERETSRAHTSGETQRVQRSGVVRNRVHFGRVGSALRAVAGALAPRRVWVLLDEWSVVPTDLQPLLADLIRRSLFPIAGVTVKIGAIEQRTHLQIRGAGGDYIGIELGADATADVNLDDFLVYEHNPDRATEFFIELVYRHVCAVEAEMGERATFDSASEVLRAFTRRSAFEELVRAAEGVPRDAINILSLAAQRSGDSPITIEDVRSAAKTWYQRDKEASAATDGHARRLLTWIADEVIGQRRTRAFLVRADERHPLIDALCDARVLHLLERDIRSADRPGLRYDAYKIDYGCYVDLLTTPRKPGGLFADGANAAQFIDVPPDDGPTIDRAILDLGSFETSPAH